MADGRGILSVVPQACEIGISQLRESDTHSSAELDPASVLECSESLQALCAVEELLRYECHTHGTSTPERDDEQGRERTLKDTIIDAVRKERARTMTGGVSQGDGESDTHFREMRLHANRLVERFTETMRFEVEASGSMVVASMNIGQLIATILAGAVVGGAAGLAVAMSSAGSLVGATVAATSAFYRAYKRFPAPISVEYTNMVFYFLLESSPRASYSSDRLLKTLPRFLGGVIEQKDPTKGATMATEGLWREQEAGMCARCLATFYSGSGRQICSRCGAHVCDDCSDREVVLVQRDGMQQVMRVCVMCFAQQVEDDTSRMKQMESDLVERCRTMGITTRSTVRELASLAHDNKNLFCGLLKQSAIGRCRAVLRMAAICHIHHLRQIVEGSSGNPQ